MSPSRKSVTVHRLNPWLTRRTTPGKTSPLTQRRSVVIAPTSMATGCRRFSELILLPGQLGDAIPRSFGDGGRELGDLVRPGRGVKDHGREPEPALQWSLPGVHVLDAGQRHERAADPEDPTLQVHLVGPNLVTPPPPPQPRHHPDDHTGQYEDSEHGQAPQEGGRVTEPRQRRAGETGSDQERQHVERTRDPPQLYRPRIQPLCGYVLQGSRYGNGGTPAQVLRGELAAGGVYILAPARTKRRRETELPGVSEESLGIRPRGGREARVRPVEAEQVQVVERMVEEFRQGLDVARPVVDAFEQGVLEEELAARPCHEIAGGVHQLGDGMAGCYGHDLTPLFLERGVEGDRQMKLLGLVCETPDLLYQPTGRYRDMPRRQPETVRVVEDSERSECRVVVEHRLAHTHDHDVGYFLRCDVPGADEDLLGDLARREVPLDPQKPRRAERAAHRASDLRGDAHRAPGLLGDHDRLYSVAVAGVEEILSRAVGSHGDTLQSENGRRSLLRERHLQLFRQVRGFFPVPHERSG